MIEKLPIPIRRIGLQVHPLYELAEDAVRRLTDAAVIHGIEIVEPDKTPGDMDNPPCQVVVSIGGDGTLLAAVRVAYPFNIPVLGINVGDLGYLTTSGTDEIEQCVERLANGDYHVESRTMIQAEIQTESGKKKSLVALNDIVVHRRVPGGGLMMLDTELNGRFLATFESDGLIISTPTGSTGYNMAAGGSILSPTLAGFIITPICAHSFSARSLIIDDSSTLVIRPRLKMQDEIAYVTADGQDTAELSDCPLRSERGLSDMCSVVIHLAEQCAGLVRFDEVFFSDVLRDKLGWTGDTSHNRQE